MCMAVCSCRSSVSRGTFISLVPTANGLVYIREILQEAMVFTMKNMGCSTVFFPVNQSISSSWINHSNYQSDISGSLRDSQGQPQGPKGQGADRPWRNSGRRCPRPLLPMVPSQSEKPRAVRFDLHFGWLNPIRSISLMVKSQNTNLTGT